MNNDDFRYMRRGRQLYGLSEQEITWLSPVNKRNAGKDNALLLLHGFSSSPAVYRLLIPKIKHYDAIVCPRLQGHAESIEAFAQSKATDWRSTAHQACDVLTKEYKKVDVLGLSLGGLLACELSQKFSLNHLFLLAPALKLRMNINFVLKLACVLKCLGFYQSRNVAGNLLAENQGEIAYRRLPLSAITEILSLVQNYHWEAPACPVDLFLGMHDAVVASQEVAQLFSALPNASIHWLKNSAHVLPIDNDFKEIIECINGSKK